MPATPAMPKISPERTSKETSFRLVPKGGSPGAESEVTTKRASPFAAPDLSESALRLPPIISSAMDRADSSRGSQVATTLPPRRIVADWQRALISWSLWEM